MASLFFQAEDGIRDTSVTGVQTCALPISLLTRRRGAVGTTWSAVAGFIEPGETPEEALVREIGRASCRERVESGVGGGALKKQRRRSSERPWNPPRRGARWHMCAA